YYTQERAVLPILKYIPENAVVWCPFDKQFSNYVRLLEDRGNKVIYSHIEDGKDFFEYEPEYYDMIISNPPYSLRESILVRLYELGKPFALLINEAGLFDSKIRYNLLKDNPFEMMIFNKRIGYFREGEDLKSVPFKSIYLCSKMLPEKLVFENIN
ncbi:hypothetical protein, partial [Chryseobacterium sp.]|uniref:hypothetical protein n=1 Tax=Chryseobacterium sp. TaxID=1871047 RepID=UPI001B1432F2